MKRLLLLAMLACALDARAAAPLQGLFGIELGAACGVCEASGTLLGEDGGLAVWRIEPPAPDPRLERYRARVDGRKGQVVDVSAVALLEAEDAARGVYEALRQEFTRRFGTPKTRELHRAVSCEFSNKGSQRVLTLLLREDLLKARWVVFVNAMDRNAFAKARKREKRK